MAESDQDIDAKYVYRELGEIKGALKGVMDLINQSHAATNQRIDDLAQNVREQTRSLNQRIDDHANRIDNHEKYINDLTGKVGIDNKKILKVSGGTSAIVSAGVAIIKEFLM